MASRGRVVNSFYELESPYFDYIDSKFGGNNYRIGLLCLAQLESDKKNQLASPVLQWLDLRLRTNRPVLYVAFSTQVRHSPTQMKELAMGLERSGLDFIWVIRGENFNWDEGYEERVADRCMLVKEWVNQTEILAHKAVQGFTVDGTQSWRACVRMCHCWCGR
jgi:hypothetical protein